MLRFDGVTVKIGGRQVLSDVSFTLKPGRLTVLVGRNGSGKSTLLNCVNQQIPYGGTILYQEADLGAVAPRQRAKQIALLPQSLPAPHITGRELAALGRNPYLDFTGRLGKADREAVETALRDAQALELGDRYADTLSGGERQRIALAMILAQNTPLMLLDEPTAHMDLSYESGFLELLRELKQTREKTILVVLHDLTQAVRYADDLAVLDGGRLVFAGSKAECLEREILEKTFGLKRYVTEGRIFLSTK